MKAFHNFRNLLVIVIVILLTSLQSSFAQNYNWVKINSPNYSNFRSIFFTNNNKGFIAGDNSILFSSNDGESWNNISFNGINLYCIKFINNNIGWTCGTNGKVFKTTDGGINWIVKNTYITNNLISIFPRTENDCWAVGENGIVIYTSNGGETWNIKSGFALVEYKVVYFQNSNVGWIAGAGPKIYKTTDGGLTWNLFSMPYFVPYDIHFINDSYGFLVGGLGTYPNNTGYFTKTNNGGLSWENTVQLSFSPFAIHFINQQNGWICGTNGKIMKTTDGGINWITESLPSNIFLWDIFFLNNNLGFVVGDNGNIWKYSSTSIVDTTTISVSKPMSFRKDTVTVDVNIQLAQNETLSSFQIDLSGFKEKLHFYKIDTSGTLVSSYKWLFQHNKNDSIIYTASAGSNNINTNGTLFKLKFIVPENSSLGFKPINLKYVLLNTGTKPFKIISGGVNVVTPKYGDVDLNNFVQAFDASMILKYLAGTIQLNNIQKVNADVTLDGTISAYDATVILKYLVHLIDSLPHPGNILASGNFSIPDVSITNYQPFEIPIYITNGADIYSFEGKINYDNSVLNYEGITFSDAFNGYLKEVSQAENEIKFIGASTTSNAIATLFCKLKFSLKQGATVNQTNIIFSKARLNENEIQSNIVTSIISILTGVETEKQIPKEYNLEQNYPNPFNPSTTIEYDLPEKSKVTLTLFNVLGEKVATLIEEEQTEGSYRFNFNSQKIANGLASGVYLYQLKVRQAESSTGDFNVTKKMLLLK